MPPIFAGEVIQIHQKLIVQSKKVSRGLTFQYRNDLNWHINQSPSHQSSCAD